MSKSLLDKYIDLYKVIEFRALNITPIFIGGYSPYKFPNVNLGELESSIARSLKAGMRIWWRRALDTFLQDNKGNSLKVSDLDEIISGIMGSTDEISSVQIHVKVMNKDISICSRKDCLMINEGDIPKKLYNNNEFNKFYNRLKNQYKMQFRTVPRVNLFRQQSVEHIHEDRLNLKIEVLSKTNNKVINKLIAISALLALTIDGIGKMKTRGFGKFSVTDIYSNYLAPSINRNLVSSMDDVKYLIITFKETTREFLESHFKTYLHTHKGIRNKVVILNVPRKSSENENLENLELHKLGHDSEVIRGLWRIGYSCLKLSWKIHYTVNPRRRGHDFPTWILGLPRSQPIGNKCRNIRKQYKKLRSGYVLLKNNNILEGRHISPFKFFIYRNEKDEYEIGLALFKLYSWRSILNRSKYGTIHHIGFSRGRNLCYINPVSSLGVINTANATQNNVKDIYDWVVNLIKKII